MKACNASTLTAGPLPAPSVATGIERVAGRLLAAGSALACVVGQWLYRLRYRHELYELSERQLADMGIDRDALLREVRKPFWLP